MLIEQAIFTSAERDHAIGYHLVARSPGIEECDARELTVWGPSHDSLTSSLISSAVSANFFRLPSGAYCISKTQLAGEEYSGRGLRTYTHCLVVTPQVLLRFANNAFALLRAAWAKGLLKVCDIVPHQLVPFQLAGRAAPVDEGLIAQLVEQCGAAKIGRLLEAVLGPKPVVLVGVTKPEATVAGILNFLPVSARGELSFTTGLKHSPRRPFRLLIAPEDSAEVRRLYRQQLVEVIDVSRPAAAPVSTVGAHGAKTNGAVEAIARSGRRTRVPGNAGGSPSNSSGAAGQSGSPMRSSEAPPSTGGWSAFVAESIERDALSLVFEQLRERREGLHLANLNELGDHLRREFASTATGSFRDGDTHARQPASASCVKPSNPSAFNEASTTDDDFLALLLSGQAQRVDEPEVECGASEIHDEDDDAAERRVHLERMTHRQAPAILIDVDSPAVMAQLELLDDVVFDAIGGDARALDEMSRIWPQLAGELGAEKLEESREQYLRYALAIWEDCLANGLREPERAIASLRVLSILFGER